MAIINRLLRVDKKSSVNPILESISGLFYVSKLFGVIPYSLSDYITKKRLQLSSLGCAFSVFACIFHNVSYHMLMTDTLVERNSETKTSTLTALIGMFIVYLEPFMMTIDVIAALVNQVSLMNVFDRLDDIDRKLERENVYLSYGQNRVISIIFIGTFLVAEIVIGLSIVFVFREEFSVLQACCWIISCVPLIINTIAKTWFLMLILFIQQRLRAINTYLNDIKRSFSERKLRHVSSSVDSKPPTSRKDNLFMETAGYLEKEIYSIRSVNVDGWNWEAAARNNNINSRTNKVGDVKNSTKLIQVAAYKGKQQIA